MSHVAIVKTGLIACGLLAPWLCARGEVVPAKVFGSGMVLQREMPAPVWGTAAPGEGVTVKFREQTKTATADAEGKWSVTLDALALGPEGELVIAGKNTITYTNVAVGDVWLGSGQSNMENAVATYEAGDAKLGLAAKESYPQMRLLTVKGGHIGVWQVADPVTIRGFSALLFYFGTRLEAALDIPIGLITAAEGGTASVQWIDERAFRGSERIRKDLAKEGRVEAELKPNMKVGEHFAGDVAPLIPFAVRGILWDQGESGTGVQGVSQYALTSSLIEDWRARWGRSDLPFLFMEKPSGGGRSLKPGNLLSADFLQSSVPMSPPSLKKGLGREQFVKLLGVPGTALVTTRDLPGGLHPPDKSLYGERAAEAVRRVVYGEKGIPVSPRYKASEVRGATVVVSFEDVGSGLMTPPGEKLRGFTMAGRNGRFYWAEARIVGDTVEVSSPRVREPAAVRYAWSEEPGWANLFGKDGLPVLSFRTDDWEPED